MVADYNSSVLKVKVQIFGVSWLANILKSVSSGLNRPCLGEGGNPGTLLIQAWCLHVHRQHMCTYVLTHIWTICAYTNCTYRHSFSSGIKAYLLRNKLEITHSRPQNELAHCLFLHQGRIGKAPDQSPSMVSGNLPCPRECTALFPLHFFSHSFYISATISPPIRLPAPHPILSPSIYPKE